jgi:hypothetical protein
MIVQKQILIQLYFFSILQSLVLIGILLKPERTKQKWILALLLMFLSWTLLSYYLSLQFPEYSFTMFPEIAWFSISPIFYILIKSLTEADYRFSRKDLLLFLIPLYNLIQIILYFLGIDIVLFHLMNELYYSIFFIYLYIVSSLFLNYLSIQKINKYIQNAYTVFSTIDQKVYFLKKYFISFQSFLCLFF